MRGSRNSPNLSINWNRGAFIWLCLPLMFAEGVPPTCELSPVRGACFTWSWAPVGEFCGALFTVCVIAVPVRKAKAVNAMASLFTSFPFRSFQATRNVGGLSGKPRATLLLILGKITGSVSNERCLAARKRARNAVSGNS
jgi:hypothetical protein